MEQRELGKSGLRVSALGLGCMTMSGGYGEADEAEGTATIHRAIEVGITFLDTADVYGAGHNETLVGRALRGVRGSVVLATKGGMARDSGRPYGVDGRPEHLRRACESSLGRLGVDAVDLYYLHRVDPDVPVEESVGAMARLVEEGKARHLGLSEVGPKTLARAHAIHPIAAVQSEYSLWTRDPEASSLPACRALGVGFVPFSPLGRGLFGARLRTMEGLPEGDFRRGLPRFQGENFGKNLSLVERLEALASAKACTAAQLALAWLLSRGEDVVPIPGTKRRTYLEENAGAVDVKLSDEDVAALDSALAANEVAGERYPEQYRRLVAD